jgi:hypothetical protein
LVVCDRESTIDESIRPAAVDCEEAETFVWEHFGVREKVVRGDVVHEKPVENPFKDEHPIGRDWLVVLGIEGPRSIGRCSEGFHHVFTMARQMGADGRVVHREVEELLLAIGPAPAAAGSSSLRFPVGCGCGGGTAGSSGGSGKRGHPLDGIS